MEFKPRVKINFEGYKNLINRPTQVSKSLRTRRKYRSSRSDFKDPNTKAISYVRAVADRNKLPDSLLKLSVKNPKPKNLRPDTRIFVRLPQNHPLRIMDTYLACTKLRSLLPRVELMKDFRIVPSGRALIVPSLMDAQDLPAASQLLKPLTGATPVEKQEIRHTFL